jgi:hypothetical protein
MRSFYQTATMLYILGRFCLGRRRGARVIVSTVFVMHR